MRYGEVVGFRLMLYLPFFGSEISPFPVSLTLSKLARGFGGFCFFRATRVDDILDCLVDGRDVIGILRVKHIDAGLKYEQMFVIIVFQDEVCVPLLMIRLIRHR